LFPNGPVEDGERVCAQKYEHDQQNERKSRVVIEKSNFKLYLNNLPHKTENPNKEKNQTNSVKLVMYHF